MAGHERARLFDRISEQREKEKEKKRTLLFWEKIKRRCVG
jgi:hypothetical protein